MDVSMTTKKQDMEVVPGRNLGTDQSAGTLLSLPIAIPVYPPREKSVHKQGEV
jgi:hypothetical protein